ncbi:paraquat-inducible protein A|uniref:paraquat-inducible protein A n=1 Tax=Noviherbaspirillum sp. L7-7A TaxID=2850560 RepID=UPI001C2BC395|nr:paraquat-inducible protein A [Noviherbaspirillum sp. L7-7A]MBV0879322.1 paraquat-inducible protein A [Noviherbaspirillum sp. L7-7A]
MPSALQQGLVSCHSCGMLARLPVHARGHCPRCHARLHARKPDSISRTWALVILAYILYIPANLLPILESRALLTAESDTIMSGILMFWESGSWMIAGLVFIASIVVPLTKLLAMTWLLVSVQLKSRRRALQRTQLFRLVEFVGRWSMLDIYVVALTVTLVQVGTLASIQVGPGALAFGAVVVVTMVAAHTFDPRLIWDAAGDARE